MEASDRHKVGPGEIGEGWIAAYCDPAIQEVVTMVEATAQQLASWGSKYMRTWPGTCLMPCFWPLQHFRHSRPKVRLVNRCYLLEQDADSGNH